MNTAVSMSRQMIVRVARKHRASVPARAVFASVVGLLLVGCSALYNSERLFWNAQKINSAIVKDPSHATPAQYAKAIRAFSRVVQKTPGTIWSARAQVSIGALFALQKRYPQSREAYTLVLQNYNQYSELCLSARIAIAKTYELEEHWEEAVTVYSDITSYHPWTKIGLEAPVYIARMYEQRKAPKEATEAYERAMRIYTKLIPDAPTPELANQVKGYVAQVYQKLGKWNEATQVLEELTHVQSGVNRPLVLFTLGTIYQARLDSPENAERVYAELVKEFPDHPFGKVAKTQLQHLKVPAAPTASPVATP